MTTPSPSPSLPAAQGPGERLISRSSPPSPFLRLWGWPLALALATTSGLLTALVSDGWGDIWSWFGLGVPVAVIAWFALVARSPSERPPAA